MDSFAQAAAYLQPSLEFVTKLSSVIPVWMMMVMADKHLLGLPLLGGSVWHSPRIPPRFTIGSGRGGQHASGSKFGRHSASPGPSPLEHDLPSSTTPFQALHSFSNFQPQGASSNTALTTYHALEVHDPFVTSSGWLEHGYVGSAVFIVVVISFAAMITKGRWYRNTSSTETQSLQLFTHEQQTEEIEFPKCWDNILEDLLSDHSDESLDESLGQPSTPMMANEDEYFSPPKMIAETAAKAEKHMDLSDEKDETLEGSLNQPTTIMKNNEDERFSPPKTIADTAAKAKRDLMLKDEKAEKTEELLEENEKRAQTETVTKVEKEQENPEEEIPEMQNEENGQEEKTETNEVVAITTGGDSGHCAEVGSENGSEAVKRAGNEDWKEGSQVDIKEEGPRESGNNVGSGGLGSQKEKTETNRVVAIIKGWKVSKVNVKKNGPSEFCYNTEDEDLEISAMPEGLMKKKRRTKQIARKRAEMRKAAAKEAKKNSLSIFLRTPICREGIVEPEELEPEASDALATAKSPEQDEVAGKGEWESLLDFFLGPIPRSQEEDQATA